MAKKTTITAEPGKQELFIIREFEAPRELVFKAHVDPDLYVQWVGPRDLTMTIEKFDMYSGGSFRFVHERDGHKFTFHGVAHEVLLNQRIIGTFEFDGLPETGHVILGTTRFEELPGDRTRLVHQSVFQSVADRDGMMQSGMDRGVNDGYEKLDDLLENARPRAWGRKTMQNTKLTISTPTEREVVLERVFNAAPHLVFDALTKPELLRQWSLPEGWTFEKCEVDLQIGGKWHFVSSQPGGKKIGQLGTYLEIVPGKRLVQTEKWEDWDAGETIVATVLEGDDRETRFRSTILFPSQEVRDIVLKSGLEKSVGPVYDKLADVLASAAGQAGQANA